MTMRKTVGFVVRRLMGLVAAAIVAALLVAPPADAKGGKDLFGLNYSFPDLSSKDAKLLQKSGAKTVRSIMFWPRIEPSPGQFDWSQPDKLVGDLAAKGIRVLPIMWGSPRWLEDAAITPPVNSPAARNAWQTFLKAAVKRYGPRGKFGKGPYKKAHRHKDPRPITTWEVWNEPNLKSAMSPSNPATYVQLLKLSDHAIRKADRHAKVMLAGLLGHPPGGPEAWSFLNGVYQQPGAKKAFDVVAVHAYAPSVDGMLSEIRGVRHVMSAEGDRKTPLWVAEVGWGSLPASTRFSFGSTKGLEGQAEILKDSFKALKQERKQWNIGKVLWFNFRDPAGGNPRICAYCTSAGLLTNNYQHKPAWDAFQKFTK
jgi:hypothetical protein